MSNLITRDSLQARIDANGPELQHWVGRALVVLFKRQTEHEKRANSTEVHNAVGFTPADAVSGCIGAKYYIKNRVLLDWQLERWTRKNTKGVSRIAKYWRQLDEAAKAKALQTHNPKNKG